VRWLLLRWHDVFANDGANPGHFRANPGHFRTNPGHFRANHGTHFACSYGPAHISPHLWNPHNRTNGCPNDSNAKQRTHQHPDRSSCANFVRAAHCISSHNNPAASACRKFIAHSSAIKWSSYICSIGTAINNIANNGSSNIGSNSAAINNITNNGSSNIRSNSATIDDISNNGSSNIRSNRATNGDERTDIDSYLNGTDHRGAYVSFTHVGRTNERAYAVPLPR
jgi:hypothetical protein